MRWSVRIDPTWDADHWRSAARAALQAGIAPDAIDWSEDATPSLLDAPDVSTAVPRFAAPSVPKALPELAGAVACHRDPQRFGILYRLLWRITHGERQLLALPTDRDVQRAMALAQAVRRDLHKMKAFVRFRRVPGETESHVAWFEPDHWIVDRVAGFFQRRFAGMQWAILTPYRSVRRHGDGVEFGPGALRSDAPDDSAGEALWLTYYANIFNPARLNPRMMRQEMPMKYWNNLPEARLLPDLLHDAGSRVRDMAEREAIAPRRRIPARPDEPTVPVAIGSLDELRQAAQGCRACPLWEAATRTVFGAGRADARIVFIGEQPGDQEDLSGLPFVGPAGQLLTRALDQLGLDRNACYFTNAVKHFRFQRSGKRRIHQKPAPSHVQACRHWLAAELEHVRPQVVVCLGTTAANALFGSSFDTASQRGRWQRLHDGTAALVTFHPAWVLRQPNAEDRDRAYQSFVADLSLLLQIPAAVPMPAASR